ncbi:NDR1/HIN1-like protein 13 [Bidens hawaiensis]|uniref:NDR1/HIN1-like protein 13 n=1 Tax=Bidens hawaiensis TaxID=980011 RepID=UPI004049068E
MEKRGPPSTSIHVGDDNPATNNLQNVRSDASVAQVPKENILIMEQRHRKAYKIFSIVPAKYVLISLLILKIILGIVFVIHLLMTKKEDPQFRVENVHVVTKDETRQQKYEFNITLASKNPNAHTIILFDYHGKTSLSFNDKKIANGEFPSSKQDPRNSKAVNLALTSFSNTELPMEIQTSLNEPNKNSEKHVEALLEFWVPVKMKIGILEVKSKTLSILCHFKVDNLAKDSRILSQDCDDSTRG